MLDLASGAGLVALCWWLAYASPLAPSIQVESVAGLVQRVRTGFEQGPPLALPMLICLALALLGAGGLVRMTVGAWKMLAPRERFGAHAPSLYAAEP